MFSATSGSFSATSALNPCVLLVQRIEVEIYESFSGSLSF